MNPPGTLSETATRRWTRALRPLARYHDYRVEGMANIPRSGGVLLVINHSLASYDAFLLGLAVFEQRGRIPVALADDNFFKIPAVGRVALAAGLHPGNPAEGQRLLEQGHMVVVAPGGTREALRPSSERYQIRWDRRRGFVRLALAAQVPIVLGACPAADDIFDVRDSRITKLAYNRFRVPVPFVKGAGLLGLRPRPVPLTHFLSEPIPPEGDVDALHARVVERMEALMRSPSDPG